MKVPVALVFVLLCLALPAGAQPATSFAQLDAAHALKLGERIRIVDGRGETMSGSFHGLTSDLLTLEVGRTERQLRQADVRRIERGFGHATLSGALLGAGAGVIATLLLAGAYGANESGNFCDTCFALWGAGIIPAGAGIGTLVGAVVDRSNRRTVFLAAAPPAPIAVAPILGKRRVGLSFTARF